MVFPRRSGTRSAGRNLFLSALFATGTSTLSPNMTPPGAETKRSTHQVLAGSQPTIRVGPGQRVETKGMSNRNRPKSELRAAFFASTTALQAYALDLD